MRYNSQQNSMLSPNTFTSKIFVTDPTETKGKAFEEQKVVQQENHIFLQPNRNSHPLILTKESIFRDSKSLYTTKRQSLFEDFSLPALYQNRTMNINESIEFSSAESSSEGDFETPVRGKTILPQNSSNFKKIESPVTGHTKHFAVENKKSRPKEKGLRKLSLRAYDIVMQLKAASYKEVANKLVDDLNNENQLDDEGKDQQNIKRRVYDALNVLIALGVLKKDCRKIMGDKQPIHRNFKEQLQQMKKRVHDKQALIHNKRQQYNSLKQKFLLSKSIVEKNKNRMSNEDDAKEGKAVFPLLLITKPLRVIPEVKQQNSTHMLKFNERALTFLSEEMDILQLLR